MMLRRKNAVSPRVVQTNRAEKIALDRARSGAPISPNATERQSPPTELTVAGGTLAKSQCKPNFRRLVPTMMASIAGGTRVGRVCSVTFGLIASGENQTEGSGPNGRNLRATVDPVGSIRLTLSTLMSAFSSSSRVNSWLYFKRLFQALAGTAGGTAVMTTVDHTLMRGLEPHDR